MTGRLSCHRFFWKLAFVILWLALKCVVGTIDPFLCECYSNVELTFTRFWDLIDSKLAPIVVEGIIMLMPIADKVNHGPAHDAAEIDLELFTFVERYATTNFRWDLILLFGNQPDSELTSQAIAKQSAPRSLSDDQRAGRSHLSASPG